MFVFCFPVKTLLVNVHSCVPFHYLQKVFEERACVCVKAEGGREFRASGKDARKKAADGSRGEGCY